MKVTVKPKEKKESCKIPFDEIPVGYVYVALYSDGPITLKLKNGDAVLLSYNDGLSVNEYLEIAKGFKGKPAYKILGKLTEIVIEEI